MLVPYVVFSATGLYWAFDIVRSTAEQWAGVPPRAAASGGGRDARPAAPLDSADRVAALDTAWQRFGRDGGPWRTVSLRLPERAGQPVQVLWLAADAPHERARSRMNVRPDGRVALDERHADLPAGRRALAAIYPLHMGTYFGLPGRIVMFLASALLPAFAVTGWLLYLQRRRQRHATRAARVALQTGGTGGAGHGADAVLVAYASQSGRAERLALQTAAALRRAGHAAAVASLAQVDAARLGSHRLALFVASTFGEGAAPDAARRFARWLAAPATGAALCHLRYGVLALGDRSYAASFCGFGQALDRGLQAHGATPLFSRVDADGEDAAAFDRWTQALRSHVAADLQADAAAADRLPAPQAWTLVRRQWLNAGSTGAPLYQIDLLPPAGIRMPGWRPGALVELWPRHAPAAVQAVLARRGWNGDAVVRFAGSSQPLREALAQAQWPAEGDLPASASAQAVADRLQPLAPRRYSVASLPDHDGAVRLLVRQALHDGGIGLASGWLTVQAEPGAAVALRLVENPAFAPAADGLPAIFIGAGSGYAGLRGHLAWRAERGLRRNWLLFGERQRAADGFCLAEVEAWLADGSLTHADFAWSRDGDGPRYVQHVLQSEAQRLRQWIADGAVVYVCGGRTGVGAGVDAALEQLLGVAGLDALTAQGRYRRDVY